MKQDLRQRFRAVALNLSLTLVSLIASFLAIELLLRANVIPNQYYVEQEILGDERGKLLLIIGDSFMAPNAGPDMGDQLFAELKDHNVRIRNAARSGAGPIRYLDMLRRESRRNKPDALILSYYVGNDLLDVGCSELEDRLDPPPAPPYWQRSYTVQFVAERLRTAFPGRMVFRSSLTLVPGWSLLRRAQRNRQNASPNVDYDKLREAGIAEEFIEAAKSGKINPWVISLGVRYPTYYRDALLMRTSCAQRAWENTARVLNLILDEAVALNVPVLPVIHPHSFQVSTAHYDLYRAWKIEVDQEMLGSNYPQARLREFFRARGLEPVDLLDAFRADGGMLYWPHDEHMNMRGMELAAARIAAAFVNSDSALSGAQSNVPVVRPRRPMASPPELVPSPVTLPFRLDFADTAARRWMVRGWHPPETASGRSFAWSRGDRSVVRLPLASAGDLRMEFEILPFVFRHSPQQRVRIFLNGSFIHEMRVRPGLHKYSVLLPAKTRTNAFDTLEFRYGYSRAPREVLPGSHDGRKLGIAWYTLDLRPVP